jgi:hypothetical protein
MFTLRNGTQEEVNELQGFDVDVTGSIFIAETKDGSHAGYMMASGGVIHYIESETAGSGAGAFMVGSIKGWADYMMAENVQPTAEGFWSKMGFEPIEGSKNWDWYAEEE